MRPFRPDPSNPPAELIEDHTVTAEPKMITIRFYKNSRQQFFRICGADADAELKTLLQDLGTENTNVANSMLYDIKKIATRPDGTIDWDIFHSILAKVRDEQPRNSRARQLAVLNAAMYIVMCTRIRDLDRYESIIQDQTGVSGLKTVGKLVLEFSEAAERSRHQSPTPVVNIVTVGEGAPTVLNGAPRQPLIEHKPAPAFDLHSQNKQDVKAELVPPVAKNAEKAPATDNKCNPSERFRLEEDPRG